MEKDRRIAVKHNKLINATHNLNLSEVRLFLMAISQIKPTDTEFSIYRIHIKDFIKLSGSNSKSVYERIRNMIKNIMSKVVYLPDLKDDIIRLRHLF